MLVNVFPDDIFWTTEHSVARLWQHHKPKCHAEKLVHCVECQGHSKGLYNQNITISVESSKLLVGFQPNLIWLYSIISRSVLWKNGITAFKVKVTAKVQNVSKCLSGWFFLHMSDRVRSVSPEPCNHFFVLFSLPNLVWWCIIVRWLSCRKIGSLSLMSRSQWGLI